MGMMGGPHKTFHIFFLFFYFMDKYTVITKIGTGSYSDVYLVVSGSEYYAAKVFCKYTQRNVALGFANDTHSDNMYFKKELDILKKIGKIRNCIVPLGCIKTKPMVNFSESDFLNKTTHLNLPCIIFEYYNTTLRDLVVKYKYEFGGVLIKRFLKDFLLIIYTLSGKNVCHFDIKPENILFNVCRKNYSMKYALSDFSNSVIVPTERGFKNEYRTSLEYRSPERWNLSEFNVKNDIYSLACVMYFIISKGLICFGCGEDENKIQKEYATMLPNSKQLQIPARKKIKNEFNEKIKQVQLKKRKNVTKRLNKLNNKDTNLMDLLFCMLRYDPNDRYSVKQCLKHKYFNV